MPWVVRVAGIDVFPVKSLPSHAVKAAKIVNSGALEYDRCCRIVKVSDGSVVDQKQFPSLIPLEATYKLSGRSVHIGIAEPGNTLTNCDLPRENARLAGFLEEILGFPVRIEQSWTGGFPDDTDNPGPTIISTATLRKVAEWFSFPLDEARRRFRSSIELDGDDLPPFWEDRLLFADGRPFRFRIGNVLIHGIKGCPRCGVPSRDTATTEVTDRFQARFAELRRATLPDWAPPGLFANPYRLALNTQVPESEWTKSIAVGDELTIAE